MIYQVTRLEVEQGNIKILVRHPQSTSRFGTERAPDSGLITDHDDHIATDLWTFENFPPAIQFTNGTNVSITPVLRWIGWTYRILQIQKTDVGKCHEVTIGGICR